MSCSDNDGGFYIDLKNIKELGKPMVDDGGGQFISTLDQQQARKTKVDISVVDHNSKISEGGLNKYKGVSPRIGKWTSWVCNERNDDRTIIWIHIRMFTPTKMDAIAFDTAVFHLRGESFASRLKFLHYVSHVKRILEDSSPSETTHNIRCVVWKVGEVLSPLTVEGCKSS
jgi:hypothetical protein